MSVLFADCDTYVCGCDIARLSCHPTTLGMPHFCSDFTAAVVVHCSLGYTRTVVVDGPGVLDPLGPQR
jgi:hypothetical protein